MAPPPIQLFLTTIASQITLRQRQEYLLRILQTKQIQFTSYDLASDEDAKRLWRRKAPRDKQQLPGILVGGEFPGTFEQFEEAVEFNELATFLRLNEDHKPFADDAPATLLPSRPIGVPGAYSPLQMHPKHAPHSRSPSPSPAALRERERREREGKEVRGGDALEAFGLADVVVGVDELQALVEELGLGGEEARALVSGLAGPEADGQKGKGKGAEREEREKGRVVVDELKARTKPLGKAKKDDKVVGEAQKSAAVEAKKEPEARPGVSKQSKEEEVEVDPSVVKITPPEDAPQPEADTPGATS